MSLLLALTGSPGVANGGTALIGQPQFRRQSGQTSVFANVALAIVISAGVVTMPRAPLSAGQQQSRSVQQPQAFPNNSALYGSPTIYSGTAVVGQPQFTRFTQASVPQSAPLALYTTDTATVLRSAVSAGQRALPRQQPQLFANTSALYQATYRPFAQSVISQPQFTRGLSAQSISLAPFLYTDADPYSPPSANIGAQINRSLPPNSGFALRASLELYTTDTATVTRNAIAAGRHASLPRQQPQPFNNTSGLYSSATPYIPNAAQIIGQPQFRTSLAAHSMAITPYLYLAEDAYTPAALQIAAQQNRAPPANSGFTYTARLNFYTTPYVSPAMQSMRFDNPKRPDYSTTYQGFAQSADYLLYTTEPATPAPDDYICRQRHRRSRR